MHHEAATGTKMVVRRAFVIRRSEDRSSWGRQTMKEISIGDVRYRIVTVERDGQWIAHAERVDTGGRFGTECRGGTPRAASERPEGSAARESEGTTGLEALENGER